ncbi:MAG: hypothetical protein QN187_13525, partial [Armatimonadota bacterium]|nr:hypothetical protein [Armatimonadota bacterium]
PWNPMRVEQRIGRFDRIGQRYPDVWVRHYFLIGPAGEPTVEARVYQALESRIDWFRAVVGELQPILARIPEIIERAITAGRPDRERVLDQLITDLRREIEAQQASAIPLDDVADLPPVREEEPAPLTLPELEATIRSSRVSARLAPHRELAGAFRLDLNGRDWEVTFAPQIADAHPGRVRLLSPGESLLTDLLALVDPPVPRPSGGRIIRATEGGMVRWYRAQGDGVEPLNTLGQLRATLDASSSEVTPVHVEQARQNLRDAVRARTLREETWARKQAEDQRAALVERARLLLATVAACRMVLDGHEDLDAAWRAVVGSGYPLAGLARLVGQPPASDLRAATSEFSGQEARYRLERATQEARGLLQALAAQDRVTVTHQSSEAQEIRLEVYGLS